jgi:hypothetical protein
MNPGTRKVLMLAAMGCALVAACGDDGATGNTQPETAALPEGTCQADSSAVPEFLEMIGCTKDFQALASLPLDDSIPGARSGKVVVDRQGGDKLYFQNSNTYPIHYDFVSSHLSGNGLPTVTSLSEFNTTEYFAPDRRFLLGAVTYYEGPKLWTLEVAPYDTANAEMIGTLFNKVKAAAFFGSALAFHPTSESVLKEAGNLPPDIRVVTTAELYEGIDYQPLNLGEAVGRVRIMTAEQLETEYVGFRDIVVLDRVPNDIAVVAALITGEFQTPLSHVNVLAQNRKTPNMGLRNAPTNDLLSKLDGKLVKLTVNAFEWSAVEVSDAEAQAFWDAHKPKPVTLPALDMSVTDLRNIDEVTEMTAGKKVTRDAIRTAVQAFGAKAANYSVLTRIEGVPIRPGFAIPVYFYVTFMTDNGFFARIDEWLADPAFRTDPQLRDVRLESLRDEMKDTPLGSELVEKLKAKLDADYPGQTMRFRSSTNAEDLDGFPCAGCYDSHTGDPADWEGDMLRAIKQTWATVWSYRVFEEREYNGIDHKSVAMALLVHHNYPDEEANGVAVTANPYDPSGLSPGFFVNVQFGGEAEVVAPPPGVTSDSFIYQYSFPNSPVIYLTRSNLGPEGTTVLTPRQIFDLGRALDAIHQAFTDAYGPRPGSKTWYAMDVEFKYDDEADPGKPASLYVKQARPYPGRGTSTMPASPTAAP